MTGLTPTPQSRRRLRILRRPKELIRPSTPRAQRRDCQGRLVAVLLELAGPQASLVDARFRPWCSATFIGAQHRLTLRIAGLDAVLQTDGFANTVSEADLTIPGHIAAEVVVDAVRRGDDGAMLIDLAVLTIEDW